MIKIHQLTLILVISFYLSAQGLQETSFQAPNDANCPSGYFYNLTNTTCDSCSSAIDYCNECSDSTTCTQCSSSYTQLQAGKCVINCSEGYYINPNKSSSALVCLSCMYNCKTCTNSSICTECDAPYVWNATQNQCNLPGGCYNGSYYNQSADQCQDCSNALYDCTSCVNSSYCTSCMYPGMVIPNGQCECKPGTYKNPDQQHSNLCLDCAPYCNSCDNGTSCNQCETSFTWNDTSKLCTKNIIDLTSNVSNFTNGNYWSLTLGTTGIPQVYQLKLTQQNIPGAFYWSKDTIYPNIYVSTNCSSQCQGFDINAPPSETTNCFTTPNTTAEAWTQITDDAITEPWCYIQFFVPNNYSLNQNFTFYYFPETTLQQQQNVLNYQWNSQLLRYYTYTFTEMTGIDHASYQITLKMNASIYQDIYIGTNDALANCNYILPSASNHCSGLQITGEDNKSIVTYTTQDQNATIYFAISNAINITYMLVNVSTSFICDTGYYQPSYYQTKCLPVVNLNSSWDLTNLSTQWQNTQEKYWLFSALNFTFNQNNIYTLSLQANESLGTFYLFFNEEENTQSIYISTNCTSSNSCPAENYTTTPSATQHCYNAILGSTQFSINTQANVGQCNFYFTIPGSNVAPPLQFAYFPQLTLSASQNYTSIPIPWTSKMTQFFTYQIPSTSANTAQIITISNINRAVISDLYFSTNDALYASLYCNSTFPSQSSDYTDCNVTGTNYSVGNMDYYKFQFKLNSDSSHVVLGFVTNQNGSYDSFDFSTSNSSSPSQNVTCPTGQYYNSTQSVCIQCSQTLTYCTACSNDSTCSSCSDSKMQIISGLCVCNTGYYEDSQNSTEICQPCMEYCSICQDSTTCEQCEAGYTQPSGQQACVALASVNWDLTNFTTLWQNGPEFYWQTQLNFTQNHINQYELQINSSTSGPGTFYLYSNKNLLPNVYVSTNCTSVTTCSTQNFTKTPSSSNSCWNANNGSNSVWYMNNNASSGICSYYFAIPSCSVNCSISFAYLPQLTLLAGQNYEIPLFWNSSAPQFFSWEIPASFPDYSAGDGYYYGLIPEIPAKFVSNVSLGSNDPQFQYRPCDYTFPDWYNGCVFDEFDYDMDSEKYHYVKFYYSNPTKQVIISLLTINNGFNSFTFNSSPLFFCNPGQTLINHVCVDNEQTNYTDSQASTFPNNQLFWNLSVNPFTPQEDLTYSLSITTASQPGTFYLISPQQLPNSYITSTCNTTTSCQYSNIPQPEINQYCFTQEQDSDALYVNTLQPYSIKYDYYQSCEYQFTFRNASAQDSTKMLYLPVYNVTDSTQEQIQLIASTVINLPRYVLYKLPVAYKQLNASIVDSFTVTISNVSSDQIDSVYFSTNDTTATNINCTVNIFPNSTLNCPLISSTQQTGSHSLYDYTFTVNSVLSFNYIGFYAKVNQTGNLQLQFSSVVNCISGYEYSQGACIQAQTCPTGQYYNPSSSGCTNCSDSLTHCSACSSSNVCTQCAGTDYVLLAGKCAANCTGAYYPNPDVTSVQACLSCQDHCLYCSDNSSCSQCEQLYFWDIKSKTCTSFTQSVDYTKLSSTQGNQWTLNATGGQQMFELTLPASSIPGSFYWVEGEIYPTVYAISNCTQNCQLTGFPSQSNFCYLTMDNNESAWSFHTDQTIGTANCQIQFYLQEDITQNKSFSFIYQPQIVLSEGSNEIQFNWNPALPRYFVYKFPSNYQQIGNATFNFSINNMNENTFNGLYFGTNDNTYCNYSFPDYYNSCQKTSSGWMTDSYSYSVDSPNSIIYVSLVAGYKSTIQLYVTSLYECVSGFTYSQQSNTCLNTYNCSSSQYYDSSAQKCVPCTNALPNCAGCTNSSVCTSCINSKLTVVGGQCNANCTYGYYTNPNLTASSSSNLCLPCLSNCQYCTNGTICITCDSQYSWNPSSHQCTQGSSSSCQSGYYYNTTKLECVLCSDSLPYCQVCSSVYSCSQCYSGVTGGQITLKNGECLVSCESGNYPNPVTSSSNVCISCMQHCLSCTNGQTCIECYEPTYKWNATLQTCDSICEVSEYYDSSSQQCVKCEVEYCTVCYGSGGQCSQCVDGYNPVQSTLDDYVCEKVHTKMAGKLFIGIIALFLSILLMIEI